MIICICGTGYSGSSAVTDYLRDEDDVSVCPYDIEFTFLYDVDGLDDLRHHLVERPVRFFSSDAAIKRYKRYINNVCSPNGSLQKLCGSSLKSATDQYLESLTQIVWHGWWHYDVYNAGFLKKNYNYRFLSKINDIKKKMGKKGIDIDKKALMYLSVKPKNFDELTKEYVGEIVNFFNVDNKDKVVLDLPFPMGEYESYKNYFSDEIKIINVIRDPRDVYIMAKKVAETYGSWIPVSNVKDFIKYFKLLCCKRKKGLFGNELTVFFEDLIYKYDETISNVNAFLGIKGNSEKKWFNPEKSKNNTQLFRKFKEYQADIEVIEKELADCLYDYSKIDAMEKWGRHF